MRLEKGVFGALGRWRVDLQEFLQDNLNSLVAHPVSFVFTRKRQLGGMC